MLIEISMFEGYFLKRMETLTNFKPKPYNIIFNTYINEYEIDHSIQKKEIRKEDSMKKMGGGYKI